LAFRRSCIIRTTRKKSAPDDPFFDERQTRDVVFVRLTPDGFRLWLNAANGVIHHDGTVEHTHGTFHLDGEIHVPRGVDDVNPVRFKPSVHTRPEATYG
jgi:hypothetical protein